MALLLTGCALLAGIGGSGASASGGANAAPFESSPLSKSAVQVDAGNTKQTGATFGYRLTYNCSSTSGPCLNAEVVDLLPPEVQHVSNVPTSPGGDVAGLQVTPNFQGSGRTRVRFVMISPLPAGNSGDLIINVRFPNGSTPDGTQATNTADGINLGAEPGTFTTPPVTVTAAASARVNLQKTLETSPANLNLPETYRLRVGVPNSDGALNLTSVGPVTDTLPPGTVFNGATPAADCQPGCVGTTPATVTWANPCAVPLTPNQNCDVNVNVTFPSSTFPSGATVTNSFTADATPLGGPAQTFGPAQLTHAVTTFVPSPGAGFSKNMAAGTPNPPTLNQTFSYDLNISNNGNVPLDNMVVVDTIPVQMQVLSVTTGAYSGLGNFAAGVGVRVSYEKNTAPGVFTLWGSSANATTNTTLNAPPPGLGAGEYITRIRWEYGQAQPGMSNTTRPLITGRITNPDNAGGPVAFGNTIQNCAALGAVYTAGPANVSRNDCESFSLSGAFVQLNPAKENLSGGGPFNPGQSVSWRLRVRSAAQASTAVPLNDLVVTDLLPVNLNFSAWAFDSRGTGLSAPQFFEQIPNYEGTGRTLLRWRWYGGSGNLGVNQEVWVNTTTTVRNGTLAGSLSNDVTLDNDAPGLGLRCSGASQTDALDLDGDGDTAETLCRATGTVSVAAVAQLVAGGTVQGACDSGFVSTSAGTLPGGAVNYRVRVQNVGTVPLQNFALIDILPFVGDTGVRDTNPRGSQFTPLLAEPVTPPAGTTVYYSTSGSPCRGEVGGPTTSCDPPGWTTVPPSPITSVRSFKVEFGSRVINPFDLLEFKINMVAPADLPAGAPAYNSFAYRADRADGVGSLAAEPQKVGVVRGSCDAATLGDRVFADADGDGVQDDGGAGLNDVTVRLFSPGPDGLPNTLDDVRLAATRTADGPDSAPGWYSFPGLAPGDYFVCASLPPNYSFSPQDAAGDALDSDANPATGCSAVVNLPAGAAHTDTDFGLRATGRATIGNYVWFDLNGDGVQNEGPGAGANGVTVKLYERDGDGDDALLATTVTADDEFQSPGYYSFGGLTPGRQYFVQFVLPASAAAFTTPGAGGDETVDSDAAADTGATPVGTPAAGECNRALDAGVVRPAGTLGLGDQVWFETDNDGVFEPQNGETGSDGVVLWLYQDVNLDGRPDAGEYAGQTTTAAGAGFSGLYSFNGLASGTYIVVVPSSNFAGGGALAGRASATGNNPAPDPDDDVNGDDNGTLAGAALGSAPVTLTDNGEPTSEDGNNDTNLTVDFGFIPAAFAPAPPAISKTFGAQSAATFETTTLTFTIANPNGVPLSNIAFNDPLPAGLVVATPNGLTGSCVGAPADPGVTSAGSVTAPAGGASIGMSGLTLAAGASCTLTINTTPTTAGAKYNRTDNVVADGGLVGGAATATLAVNTAPTASATPNPAVTNEDAPVQITLAGADADDDALTFTITDEPDHGTLSAVPSPDCSAANVCTAAVTYTPAADYNGPDSFKFEAGDGAADSEQVTVSITVNPVSDLTVSDVARAEGNSGPTPFTFSVTLDSPAGPGGVSFNASTADGAAASGSDYAGLANQPGSIPEGQTSTTLTVQVTGDTTQEADETFTVNVSNVAGAQVADGQGAGTIMNDDGAPAAGQVIISEFRFRGPGADAASQANNEFVEIYNASDSSFVVVDAAPVALGQRGWAIVSSDAPLTPKYVIPAGTLIPARGHFLVTNLLGYSLSAYAAADAPGGTPASYAVDIPDWAGLALFRTGTPLAGAAGDADILDRVGFKVTGAPFFEGTGLDPVGGVTASIEHSFFRKMCDFVAGVGCTAGGNPGDTNDNEADFAFADTQASNVAGLPRRLGAPGPENISSPIRRDTSGVGLVPLDGTVSTSSPPNRVRDFTADGPNNSPFGTLAVRRRVVNNTGAPVTRLRFRIVEMTTFPSPAGTADLRARTSPDTTAGNVSDPATCAAAGLTAPCAVTVLGTTLEEPPNQPNGGGINSSLVVPAVTGATATRLAPRGSRVKRAEPDMSVLSGTVPLGAPLSSGESVNVQFLLGIQQTGTFRFLVIIEALP